MTSTTTAHIVAMIIVGILAIAAMSKEIDGQLFALCIIAISGLGGYEVYKQKKIENGEKGGG